MGPMYIDTPYIYIYIHTGCLNIHGTANNNNVVFFFISDLKIVHYNNY